MVRQSIGQNTGRTKRRKEQRDERLEQKQRLPEQLVEVIDPAGRTLMFMPLEQVLQQKLPHRAALVLARDKQGKIYLRRRSSGQPGRPFLWTVSAFSRQRPGEALEDAARRGLREELGVSEIELRRCADLAPGPDGARTAAFISAPTSLLLNPGPEEVGLFADREELSALLREMPDLIAPELKLAVQACDLPAI